MQVSRVDITGPCTEQMTEQLSLEDLQINDEVGASNEASECSDINTVIIPEWQDGCNPINHFNRAKFSNPTIALPVPNALLTFLTRRVKFGKRALSEISLNIPTNRHQDTGLSSITKQFITPAYFVSILGNLNSNRVFSRAQITSSWEKVVEKVFVLAVKALNPAGFNDEPIEGNEYGHYYKRGLDLGPFEIHFRRTHQVKIIDRDGRAYRDALENEKADVFALMRNSLGTKPKISPMMTKADKENMAMYDIERQMSVLSVDVDMEGSQ